MKQPDKGWSKVESVQLSNYKTHPFFVQGNLICADGHEEHFSWSVPSLDWAGYDFTKATWTDEAIAEQLNQTEKTA